MMKIITRYSDPFVGQQGWRSHLLSCEFSVDFLPRVSGSKFNTDSETLSLLILPGGVVAFQLQNLKSGGAIWPLKPESKTRSYVGIAVNLSCVHRFRIHEFKISRVNLTEFLLIIILCKIPSKNNLKPLHSIRCDV